MPDEVSKSLHTREIVTNILTVNTTANLPAGTTVSDLSISGQVQGDVLYFNGTNWVRLAAGTSGKFLKTQGAAANPTWDTVTPTDLAIASQAQGDILYFNGTNWVRLAAGTSGKFLKTQGASANPIWDTVSSGALTLVSTQTLTDASSYTFSGLTGRRYKLVIELDCADSGRVVSLELNGVNGAGTNSYQISKAAATTASAIANASTTSIVLVDSTPGAAAVWGVVELMCATTGASSYPACNFNIGCGTALSFCGNGKITTAATTFSSIKVQISSGDMSGLLSLYAYS